MVKCIVVKVVLGLMFVMSSTVLFSQDSKVKYPDISGIWKIANSPNTLCSIFQKDDMVFLSVDIHNKFVSYHFGKFVSEKQIQLESSQYFYSGCVSKSKNVFTLLTDKKIKNDVEVIDNNCNNNLGWKGSNILEFVKRIK